MSAYICNPDHIKQLAAFATRRVGGPGNGHRQVDPRHFEALRHLAEQSDEAIASAYADLLYQENIRSVSARYPDDTFDTLPGPHETPKTLTVTHTELFDFNTVCRLTPVDILKMCDGLEYQSCETDDYRETIGFTLLDSIRGAAIRALPGYEDAPWEYYRQTEAVA